MAVDGSRWQSGPAQTRRCTNKNKLNQQPKYVALIADVHAYLSVTENQNHREKHITATKKINKRGMRLNDARLRSKNAKCAQNKTEKCAKKK